jgi:hypothetical protein
VALSATNFEQLDRHLDSFLFERLLGCGVSDRQLSAAQSFHREVEGRQPLSQTLVELGLASDEAIARWIAEYYGWRYLPREDLRVDGDCYRQLCTCST